MRRRARGVEDVRITATGGVLLSANHALLAIFLVFSALNQPRQALYGKITTVRLGCTTQLFVTERPCRAPHMGCTQAGALDNAPAWEVRGAGVFLLPSAVTHPLFYVRFMGVRLVSYYVTCFSNEASSAAMPGSVPSVRN